VSAGDADDGREAAAVELDARAHALLGQGRELVVVAEGRAEDDDRVGGPGRARHGARIERAGEQARELAGDHSSFQKKIFCEFQ
jgi:hypothetical protein